MYMSLASQPYASYQYSSTDMGPDFKVSVLLAVAAADVMLLTCLSSRRGRTRGAKHGRFILWAASALYFPLISYILTNLTNDLSSLANQSDIVGGDSRTKTSRTRFAQLGRAIMLTAFVQSLKSNADMAALAVAAVASPVAGADDIDNQKIRPSMDSLVYSFWLAGFAIYTVLVYGHHNEEDESSLYLAFLVIVILTSLLWALGAGRMVLTFAAFRHANGSFALGRNAQLIDGYMAQLQEGHPMEEVVPRLILTGERKEDVEESPRGYRVKPSALDGSSSLVTLDKVWSCSDHCVSPELKDLCLSFCLFKCLRRWFAGYQLAEAGSVWTFRFVCDGLLCREDDHERMFRVIAHELSFASDFYYSPLPVASLGAWPASFHFILSLLIGAPLFIIYILSFLLTIMFVLRQTGDRIPPSSFPCAILLAATVGASIELWAIVTSVHSNWTKISMVAHFINRSHWSQLIPSCLLRCESPRHWKDVIGQCFLLKPSPPQDHLLKQIFLQRRNQHVKVTSDVKAAVIRSLRVSEHRLSNGIATVQRRRPDLSWACGGDITTSTDAIIVWHIATSLFECSPAAAPASKPTTNMDVANNFSRYCMYLVAEAPDLLPDNAAWTKLRYRQVKKCVETSMCGAGSESDMYWHLVESFGKDNSHEVVKMGLRLGRQLVQEVQRQREENQAHNQEESVHREEEAMWELLAEFWSEMILYLAPSDDVKGHIEALQRGGELITLLWVLLLHAGITSRPAYNVPEP